MLSDTFKAPVQVMTVVAYNGDFVTRPRYVLSNDSLLTEESGSVISIPLILEFSKGKIVEGYWSERGCVSCSDDLRASLSAAGQTTDLIPRTTCVRHDSGSRSARRTCAVSIDSCADCLKQGNLAEQTTCLDLCSTSFNVGWAGTDANLEPLISSFVITQADDYSISGLFKEKFAQAANATQEVFSNVVDGISGLFGR